MTTRLAPRLADIQPTVFSEFTALAQQHQAVNLGQGFPDFDGPVELREAAERAMREGHNQYAPGQGSPNLRRAVADHAERFYGQRLDPQTMITVTSGATEAIFDAILGLAGPGDEVILFEPFYDSYLASVTLAGAQARFVTLLPPDAAHAQWWFDEQALAGCFTSRTRLLVLNTPHNPTGKVFTWEELERIGALCLRHGVPVLCDEVYEHIAFPPARHLRMATLPGMAEQTLTVSSGGKTFSATGWKVGWAMGHPPLLAAVQKTHQYVTFATASPLQEAIAAGLRLPDRFFQELSEGYRQRRDRLLGALRSAGLPPFCPQGAYFVLVDAACFGFDSDRAFCRGLIEQVGVAAIPLSPFVHPGSALATRCLARLAFCKTREVLAAGELRLARVRNTLKPGTTSRIQ